MYKKLTVFFTISIIVTLSGCFDRDIQCNINNLEINSDLLDLPREDIIAKLGFATKSDLGIKNFDEYAYLFDGKAYSMVIRYRKNNESYYVSSYRCIKLKPRIEVSNRVIWH